MKLHRPVPLWVGNRPEPQLGRSIDKRMQLLPHRAGCVLQQQKVDAGRLYFACCCLGLLQRVDRAFDGDKVKVKFLGKTLEGGNRIFADPVLLREVGCDRYADVADLQTVACTHGFLPTKPVQMPYRFDTSGMR